MRIDLTTHIDHVRERVLQDALTQALPAYWLRRAEYWDNAKPKLGEYHGNATREELRAAHDRCTVTAENCRRHAALLTEQLTDAFSEDLAGEIAAVLDEVAA